MACVSSGNATLRVNQNAAQTATQSAIRLVKSRKALPEPAVENYFNYFTEIEEHYQRRRGTGLLLSTLDWALIETWKQANIPLEAVLRGIDMAFDRWERRPKKTKRINGLGYCSQEVMSAAED